LCVFDRNHYYCAWYDHDCMSLLSVVLFLRNFGFCPEIAWWACMCRQAAHHCWLSFGCFCLSCLAVGGIAPGGSYVYCCFTCFLEFLRVLGVPLGKLLYGNVNYS